MGQYNERPNFLNIIKDLKRRLQALENTQQAPTYTSATRPGDGKVTGGTIIFVSDATAGQRYQGWDATAAAWVPLG